MSLGLFLQHALQHALRLGRYGAVAVLGFLLTSPTKVEVRAQVFDKISHPGSELLAQGVRGDPAARLLPGEFASERWELTARFDSGHLLFAEFLITNLGFGDRNAAVIGHIIAPNGNTRRFRNGRREGRWSLSPDRLRIEVGSSLLDQSSPMYRLRVDKRSVQVGLSFRPDSPARWSDDFAPSGYALDLLGAATPIEGTLWVKKMEAPLTVHGSVAVTHSWMSEAESNLVMRRIEFFSLQENFSLYLADLTTPRGVRTQWIVVKQEGQMVYESQDLQLSLGEPGEESRRQDYVVPGVLHFESPQIGGQIQVDRILLRYDPLVDLPQPFRLLLALKMQPQRVWALSPFAVSFRSDPGQVPIDIRGTGVTKVTFLNPM